MKKIISCRIIVLLSLALFFTCSVVGQPRRPMTAADLSRLATVSDAQISPDGSWVVYTVSTADRDKQRSTLWIVRTGADTSQTALDAARQSGRGNAPAPLLPDGWEATGRDQVGFFPQKEANLVST
jgi:hypothetical protein